ncbi:uncharacterized protein LOC131008012 [Salvia miltiorrhiza]|uniref:uncharacterized protein LOC131008012 n=1 Tax=Salvia miltiorrhiza TaxID=226208 RepID=UPI0025AB857E|nr:uncharacterized protein LOC131008012 [Salvia miltiorrhiza]
MWDAIHDVFAVIRDYLSAHGFDCMDPAGNLKLMAVKQETFDQPTEAAATEETLIAGTTEVLVDDSALTDDDAPSKSPTEEPSSPPRSSTPEGHIESLDPESPRSPPPKSPSPSPEEVNYTLAIIPTIFAATGDAFTLSNKDTSTPESNQPQVVPKEAGSETDVFRMEIDAPTDIPTADAEEMVVDIPAPDVTPSTKTLARTPNVTPVAEPETGVEKPQTKAMVIDDIAVTQESTEVPQQTTDVPDAATEASTEASTKELKLDSTVLALENTEAPKTDARA